MLLCAIALLTACAAPGDRPATASTDHPRETTPAPLQVRYTPSLASGAVLKQTPTEVRIVRRDTTGKAVATQVFLNVGLAMLGGLSWNTFGKDDLNGEAIESERRDALRNLIPDAFVDRLSRRVLAHVQADPTLRERSFAQPLWVGGGSAKLVYDTLSGTDEARYELKTYLDVYKRRESAGVLTMYPLVTVDCSAASGQALPLQDWARDDHAPVRDALQGLLDRCEERVLARLPELLKD